MNIKTDIAQHLHNLGIGTLATTLFSSFLPDSEENFIIAVYDRSGLAPDVDIPTDKPRFQVFIRSKEYETGKAKLDAIFNALHKPHLNAVLVPSGTYFYYIHADSSGAWIGRNDADKDEFSINFTCYVRRA
jgi:hypothetical protein